MHVVVFAASKGGVGKTTLTSSVAVRAAKDNPRVAMIDFDPQEGLTGWWARRGAVDNPRIFSGVDTIEEAIELLEMDGWDWLMVDTGPGLMNHMRGVIDTADIVVVPLKPSAHDLTAIDPVMNMIKECGARYLVTLNDVEPRWRLTKTAAQFLEEEGHPLASRPIARREAYAASATIGKSGPEVEREKACAEEIDSLWSDIRAGLGLKKKGARK